MSSQNDDASSAPVGEGLFRRVCGRFVTGVTVVTTRTAAGDPVGLTVNSFSSVSLEPPLVLVSINSGNSALARVLDGAPFAINILATSGEAWSRRFSAIIEDRFQGIAWTQGILGAPILPETLGYFECVLEKAVEAGDHTILIGAVKDLRLGEGVSDPAEPLVFFDGAYRALL